MGIATGSLIALVFRVSDVFLWGFIGVLTARTLTVEERGVYATAIIVTSAVGGISSLASATGYFVSNQKRDPAEVGANALTAVSPVVVAILLLGMGFAIFGRGSGGHILALATLSMAPGIIRGTSLGVILGQNSLVKFNIGGDITVLLAIICLGVWLGLLGHRTAENGLQAWCLAQYLSLVPFAVWGRSWLRWFAHHRPNRSLIWAMVRFSSVTGIGGVIGLLNYRMDQFLVFRLDGREGAGIYASAIAGAEGLWLFSSAITLASFARVGRGNPREAASLTATGIRHTVLVVICGGLSAALIGPYVIEFLFGHAYSAAGQPFRILCLGTALFAPQGMVNLYFVNHVGMPRFPLLVGIMTLTASFIGGIILIPAFGTSGAASATSISYAIATTVSITVFLRRTRLPASELWRIRLADLRAYWDLGRYVLGRALGQRPAISRPVE
ncbi:MAG: polysaccharide biosynthesis C-terminal domain-containing protein [bacterium]